MCVHPDPGTLRGAGCAGKRVNGGRILAFPITWQCWDVALASAQRGRWHAWDDERMAADVDDVVFEVTEAEFHAAARRGLADAEVTYGELAQQARCHAFDNDRLTALWLLLGGLLPDDFA